MTRSIRPGELSAGMERALRPEHFFRRPRVALWCGAGLVGLVVLIGLFIPAQPLAVDRRWSEAMTDIPSATLHHLALLFNYLGRRKKCSGRSARSIPADNSPGRIDRVIIPACARFHPNA